LQLTYHPRARPSSFMKRAVRKNRNEQAQACHRERKHPTQSLRRHVAQ
jgi:hypothetical protein